MMKKILLTLVAFMAIVAVNAQQVSRQQALQKAQQFMPGKQFGEVRSFARKGNVSEREPFYIFNAEGKKGYVIVSGDDRTRPILGYAERGNLEEDNMPDNMKWWLNNLARQIEAIGTSLNPAVLMAANMAEIKPLIQTEWNQGAPYNYMCPDENMLDKGDKGYNADKLCITGCVATAMAQIMYYWKWPKECPALDSYPRGYYDDNWNFIETSRVKGLPATTFKWDKMKTTYEWRETGEAADAVAELMRYCGQAVNMGYGLDASAAYLSPEVMASVFNYSKNVRSLSRDYYTTAQWEALVYEELKAKRPVPYSGGSDESGHQFIVDGYRGDGLFHFNWGWGYLGSYSVLSVADPSVEQAIGGRENKNAFQYGQYALLGVKPAEAGEVMMPVIYARLDEFLAKYYSRPGANADFKNVDLNAYVEGYYTIDPETERDVQLGWGLYQDDQFVMCLASQTKKLFVQRYNYIENNQTVSFGAGLEAGKYQLCQIFRFSDNEQWQRCENYGTNSLVAEVSATTMTIRKPDLENMSFTVNSLTTSENPEAGNPMNFIVNVTNTGESSKIVLNLWIQKEGGNAWSNVAQGEFYVDPGKDTDIYLGYTPTEAGTYNLKVTGTSEEALFTSKVTIAVTEIIIIDNVKYLCTPAYKHATVIQNEDAQRDVSSITIQKTVTASGVTCQVKAIADYALNNFWNINKIDIPEGVEIIGARAMSYMSNLARVILPSTIKRIGENAFYGNSNLEVVVSSIANPCELSDKVFKVELQNSQTNVWEVVSSPATLYIPVRTKSRYDEAGWTVQFTKVVEGELLEGFDGVLKYSYSTGSDEATVIQDDSYQELTEVTIPATATLGGKSYKVTAVGTSAFRRCNNLTSVALPTGLVSIGKYSFQNSGIKKIVFPNTLKSIGDGAFENCWQITAVTLPDKLESVGPNAFSYMLNLQKVVLPSTLQSIGDRTFFRNQNLTSVESHISEPFDISESVFAGSSDWDDTNNVYIYSPSPAKLYVPAGTKSKYVAAKGWNMFAAIEEGEVKEGFDGVLKYSYSTGSDEATVIQDDSYQELNEVTIPATATLGGKSYKVTAVGNRAFRECYNLTSVTLPSGLVSIGNYSFYNAGIKEITFPNTLKSIGEGAFEYCRQITAVTLPSKLESVGAYAFYSMSNLQKVVLPSTLQSIGDRAFFSNQNLISVESHITDPFDILESVFAGTSTWDDTNYVYIYSPSSAKLYVPADTKSKYVAAKGWNMFAAIEEGEQKEGFDGVLKYSYSTGGDEAIVIQDDSYKELNEVTIPATATLGGKSYKVTAVGNSAFRECYNLTSVTLPSGLVSIGNYSFRSAGIKEIAFPNTLKSIGNGTFESCWQITEITLPVNLESVGSYAFGYMSSLQKVVLPSTLQSIGEGAFFFNQNLTSVESHITKPFDISESVFATSSDWDNANYVSIYSPSSAILYVPTGTKRKYEAAKGWNLFAGIEEMEPSTLPGDADGSGDVNAADIDAVVRYILTGDMTDFVFKNANLNGDKNVDVSDLVLFVKSLKK